MAKRDLILHNFGWKLISLLLAGLMWMAIDTALRREERSPDSPVTTEHSRVFTVPVTLLTSPTNTFRYLVVPDMVEVKLVGKPLDLKALNVRQITAYVDVTDPPDERRQPPPVRVQAPAKFLIDSVKPEQAGVERIAPPG